jgi:outer membrane autotransporter protein
MVADTDFQVLAGGSITGGTLTNTTAMGLADGARVTSNVVNTGIIVADGTTQAGGNLTNNGVIDLQDGAGGDVVSVSGDAVLNGTFRLDVDLSEGGTSFDALQVGGAVSGDITLDFENIGTSFGILGGDYNVVTFGTDAGLDITPEGLPTTGAVLFSIDQVGNNFRLVSGANPAIGNLASGLTLTQSLIGTVVNRPTSPFVTGLAAPDEEPCGLGAWSRATGGNASASGTTTTAIGESGSEIEAVYAGIQAGFDYSCFDGTFRGWDLTFGGIAGINTGSLEQPVFEFDSATSSINPAVITSFNNTDFTQIYGGLYVAASRDRWFADVQLRFDRTDFELENVAAAGDRLNVIDQDYTSTGVTLSGSAGYAFSLGAEDSGWSLVPSIGFQVSRIEVDNLQFDTDDDGIFTEGTDGFLVIDDITNAVGFVSATLARTRILPSGDAALNYFGTLTYYNDFSDDTISRFFETGTATSSLDSTSTPLGSYGEISLGLNYTKLLNPGQIGPARQFDASVRVDGRFSSQLDSIGLTVQGRLQF